MTVRLNHHFFLTLCLLLYIVDSPSSTWHLLDTMLVLFAFREQWGINVRLAGDSWALESTRHTFKEWVSNFGLKWSFVSLQTDRISDVDLDTNNAPIIDRRVCKDIYTRLKLLLIVFIYNPSNSTTLHGRCWVFHPRQDKNQSHDFPRYI